MSRRCFICGIDNNSFERAGLGFKHHVEHDHNMWSYVQLWYYLMEKPQSEFSAQESYVWRLLQRGDTSFLPVGVACALADK